MFKKISIPSPTRGSQKGSLNFPPYKGGSGRVLLTFALLVSMFAMAQKNDSPLRIGVSGVAHGHLWNLINAMNRGDFVIVGVAEENPDFRAHNNLVGRLPKEKFYASLTEMLDKEKPEVVVDYGSILVQEEASSLMSRYPGMTLEDIFIELTGKY